MSAQGGTVGDRFIPEPYYSMIGRLFAVREHFGMDTAMRRVIGPVVRAEDGDLFFGVDRWERDREAVLERMGADEKFLRRGTKEFGYVDQFGVFMGHTEAKRGVAALIRYQNEWIARNPERKEELLRLLEPRSACLRD